MRLEARRDVRAKKKKADADSLALCFRETVNKKGEGRRGEETFPIFLSDFKQNTWGRGERVGRV